MGYRTIEILAQQNKRNVVLQLVPKEDTFPMAVPIITLATQSNNTVPQVSHLTDPNGSQTFTINGVSFKMVAVQAGTFNMGATLEQKKACKEDEKPVHSVTLNSFYVCET